MKVSEEQFQKAFLAFCQHAFADPCNSRGLRAAIESMPDPAPVPGAAVRALATSLRYSSDHNKESSSQFTRGIGQGLGEAAAHLESALREDCLAEPAKPESVPGAAVRALVAKWREQASADCGGLSLRHEKNTLRMNADELESALKDDGYKSASQQDGLAGPAEMPRFQVTREEAELIAKACGWEDASPAAAKHYIDEIIARRAATDAVRPEVCTLAQAERIRLALGPGGSSAVTIQAAINAELCPATDEVEASALRDEVADLTRYYDRYTTALTAICERFTATDLLPIDEKALRVVADLESKLAQVTRERDVALREHKRAACDLNELRAQVAHLKPEKPYDPSDHVRMARYCGKLEVRYSRRCERNAELRAEKRTLRKERDEALAKLAALEARIGREVETAVNEQLAARPAPVVIDEALAELVLASFYEAGDAMTTDAADMLEALRKVFGTHASVTVPQGDPRIAEHDETRKRLADTERRVADLEEMLVDESARASGFEAGWKASIEARIGTAVTEAGKWAPPGEGGGWVMDWKEAFGDMAEPNEKERGYAAAVLATIAMAPSAEMAQEFLARVLAAHRVRATEVAVGMAVEA